MNGSRLLAEFRDKRSEGAFSDLVCQYTNLVYSVAKRRVGNDLLAQEVTQIVFIRLAKALPKLRGDAELVAWLHRVTVHASIDLWRAETRRRAREKQAVAMQTGHCEAAPWNELAFVLDEALNELNDADRAAILLRFFDEKTMREVGTVFGVSEDAAKMRVSRALDRLRDQLSAHGVTCSATALGSILSERAVETAPSQLVTSLSALKRPAAGLGTAAGLLTLLQQVTTTKLVLGVAAMLGLGAGVVLFLKSRDSTVGVRGGDGPQIVASEGAASEQTQSASLQRQEIPAAAEEEGVEPDPLKLLETVARARGRIASGSVAIELSIANASIEHAHWKQTNVWQFKVIFDGQKRSFEQVGREGDYTLPGKQADAQKERIQKEQLSREAAIQEGLLKEFEARYGHGLRRQNGIAIQRD